MEVILLERVAKLGQMGDVVRVKDGFARNFLLPQGQGAARHRRQQDQVRNHEGRPAGAQRRRQGRSRQDRHQARRPELRGAAPGVRDRPAVRLGVAARSGGAAQRRRLRRRPQSDRAQRADQDPSACTRCRCMLHPEVEVDDHRQRRAQRRRGRAAGARRGRHGRVAREATRTRRKPPQSKLWPRSSSSRRPASAQPRARNGAEPARSRQRKRKRIRRGRDPEVRLGSSALRADFGSGR